LENISAAAGCAGFPFAASVGFVEAFASCFLSFLSLFMESIGLTKLDRKKCEIRPSVAECVAVAGVSGLAIPIKPALLVL
jgi:hypothetical protein